jgi:hypothetical protein
VQAVVEEVVDETIAYVRGEGPRIVPDDAVAHLLDRIETRTGIDIAASLAEAADRAIDAAPELEAVAEWVADGRLPHTTSVLDLDTDELSALLERASATSRCDRAAARGAPFLVRRWSGGSE